MTSYVSPDQERNLNPHPYKQHLAPTAKPVKAHPQSYSSEASRDFNSENRQMTNFNVPNIPYSKASNSNTQNSSPPIGSTSDSDNVFQSASSMMGAGQGSSSSILNNNEVESFQTSLPKKELQQGQNYGILKQSHVENSDDFVPPNISNYGGTRPASRNGSTTSLPHGEENDFRQSRTISSPLNYHDPHNMSSRSQSPSSESHTIRRHERQSKSVDLSHLYLLDRNESAHFTLTNEHLSDQSHALIKQYLGDNNALLPRMKTIEMYRRNVRKSNDPTVLFQFAQYMLQTALTIDVPVNGPNSEEREHLKNLKEDFLKDATRHLKKLADKGYTDAQYLLGDAYSSGALGKIDNKEAFSLFQGAAKHGHIESAYRTAYCYEEGLGTSRDSRRAIEFLRFAASKNHPAAMFKLGIYSFNAKMGFADNVTTKKIGINWLSRATNAANELTNAAPFELGKIHEQGFLDIVIPDRKYAFELYIQAASLGNTKAAAILGKAYEFGDGDNDDIPENQKVIIQDASLSIHYYTQAAIGGDPESMLALCAWYLVGHDPALAKDETEGFLWALRAANINYPKAQYTVGHLYEKGIGCDVNMNEAMSWYENAHRNGYTKALKKLKKKNSSQILTNGDLTNSRSQSIGPLSNVASSPAVAEGTAGRTKAVGAVKEEKRKADKKEKKKKKSCTIM
ncbi:hypothetical protein WICPIJ_008202 [Wickerhamomyces pijperi]|uniref:Protein SKT5 n=1 Tax=Wickerhamomyces pijperi TaxID=599730 RepID=A0A9P8TIA2_WICPI|nr:hypothetical protein WICPIJ_008202 [Wickerhamomyces pijperi]